MTDSTQPHGESAPVDEFTVGSLFSGIGGLELGLERAGSTVLWQSEINPYASSVLAKHWPHVPNLGDVTSIVWEDVPRVDLICGGFPCQDLSTAHTANGGGVGLRGQKSGLWRHFLAAVDALRPAHVLVENIARWRYWVPEVRADLALLGYASLPVVLHAGSFGAPHKRARCFLVAHADGHSEPARTIHAEVEGLQAVPVRGGDWGVSEPSHLRVADGPADRMDRHRLTACGNAVVPQVAEWVGRHLVACGRRTATAARVGRPT